MATNYRKVKTAEQNWLPRDHQDFDTLLNSLKWESYPNGNSGWDDHGLKKFIKTGFIIVGGHGRGTPAVISDYILDINPSRHFKL